MTDNDKKIMSLFDSRSEEALELMSEKYGKLGLSTAKNILGSPEDAEECVSDALGVLWAKIPPEHPDPILPYFLRVVRNIALNRRREKNAMKRSNGDDLPIDDFAELISFDDREEDSAAIRDALDGFLGTLAKNDRVLFMRRYWFEEETADVAKMLGITENHARVKLTRIKAKLRKYLKKEGIDV